MSNFVDENVMKIEMDLIEEHDDVNVEVSEKEMEAYSDSASSSSAVKRKRQVTTIDSSKCATALNDVGSFARRNRSPYWEHFEKADDTTAKCKYCSKMIRATSKNGTSGMKNHIERCPRYPANLTRKQCQFDQEEARKSFARMFIMDELPFMYVESEGLQKFFHALNPAFVFPSRQTLIRDCYGLFIDELEKMKIFFRNLSSRVCLTADTWTSSQNLCYLCLTAHFVDDDWKLQSRIINFCSIASHSGELIGRVVEQCLLEWGLKRILTVTVENSTSDDLAIQYLRRRINHWGNSVLDGKFLHMRCATHILNSVVKDGLKDLDASILKIRTAIRYVRSYPTRMQKFKACVEEEKIEYKNLVYLDVETRWDSTFLMIESSLKFRKAFDKLQSRDDLYVKELRKVGGAPCDSDWNRISCFLPFLKVFYDAILKLSGGHHVTSNSYVPHIYGVGDLISTYCQNDDESIRNMAQQMKAKFNKYWGNVDDVNVLLFVALVLDPRFKMDYVDWILTSSYPGESAQLLSLKVKMTLRELFENYDSLVPHPMKKVGQTKSPSSQGESEQPIDIQQLLTMKYRMKTGTLVSSERKNELDTYLTDQCEADEDTFDILQWWRDQKKRYPVLTMIARDVLAIPVSTVASGSIFSTEGRVLDSFRSSLTPRMVEALICAQDWFRSSNTSLEVEESIFDMEKLEQDMEQLTSK